MKTKPPKAPALIVGIGASAGGIDAFIELLRHLPADTGLAYVFLLHLNPAHKSRLTEILGRAAPMPVVEARHGVRLRANTVYVMPPKVDMTVSQGRLRLEPATETVRAPIDSFFSALARDQGNRAVGVVLSGMASDGTIGLEEIKAAGGITCAQDEASAEYGSMPRAAAASGCADLVRPPKGIARELIRLGRHPMARASGAADDAIFDDAAALRSIFSLLQGATGVDFSLYKPSTMRRRIARRMLLLNIARLHDYLRHLKAKPAEAHALYNDLLINVTSFRRDPEVFDALQRKVFPSIVKGRDAATPVRLWCAGCATGEEAYSLAISYLEFTRARGVDVPASVFATDISDVAAAKARKGFYPETIAAVLSPDLLARYFVKTAQGYQVSKRLREMCIFARHDVTADPPFANQDLISCRNLLIYLEPTLQKTVLSTFHYALRPDGFLVLGSAESATAMPELFSDVDKTHKIYARKESRASRLHVLTSRAGRRGRPGPVPVPVPVPAPDALSVADRIALSRFAPAGVVVNRDLDILQFRGDSGRFLKAAPGKASLNLLRMAPESMRHELSLLVRKAFKSRGPVRKPGVLARLDRGGRRVDLEASAFEAPPGRERFCLVSFLPQPAPSASAARTEKEPRGGLLRTLKRELAETRGYLQDRIEESEARNADLSAANEEIASSNEELQSANEELESSREELQTANEELNTLNDELRKQNASLVQLGGDLDNILDSLGLPIVLLSLDLRIRRVTKMEDTPLALTDDDVGRSILDIQKKLALPDLEEIALQVLQTSSYKEIELAGGDGRWYKLRIRPYKGEHEKVEGIVLALLDADVAKRALLQLQDAMDQSLLILGADLRLQSANARFFDHFRLVPSKALGRPLRSLAGGAFGDAGLTARLRAVLARDERLQNFELECRFDRLGQRLIRLGAVRVPNEGRTAHTLFLTMQDITDMRRSEAALKIEENDRIQREFVANLSHELRTPVTAIKGYAQTLKAGGLDDLKIRHKFVDTIERHADRLAALIEDLLRISHLTEHPKPRRRRTALAPLARKAVSDHGPQLERRRIAARVEAPASLAVSAEAAQISTVFDNLVDNAIKHGRKGGRLTIKLAAAGGEAVISVEDDGPGIAAKDLPRVFDRFYRTRPAKSRPGAGLGLSIVQQIVVAHGGRVWVESRRGRGTAVRFTLPLAK